MQRSQNLLSVNGKGKSTRNSNQDYLVIELLKSCAKKKDLDRGTILHDHVMRKGLLEKSPYIAGKLIHMYAKCGMLAKAHQILEEIPNRDVVIWSALISGYAQHGHGHQALICFERMQREDGLVPDDVTFTSILKACGSIGAIRKGQEIHDNVVERGILHKNVMVSNALVDMYAKCGLLEKARDILEDIPIRNTVSWNALIGGYARHEHCEAALNCYQSMRRENISANEVTFLCILRASASIGAIDKGKQIHEEIVDRGFLLHGNIFLGNALVDMYAKCGLLAKARKVLEELPIRNVVTWSALISGYVQHGHGRQALDCFAQMQREGLSPNEITFTSILKACGSIGAIDEGEKIHNEIANNGLLEKNIELGNALVDMYVKCGCLEKSQRVLRGLRFKNVVSWSTLIAGYTKNGQAHEALNCYAEMQREGVSPNNVTFTCILNACGSMGAIDKGKQLHNEIVSRGLLEENIALGNALVDMYAKCGYLSKAEKLVEELPFRNIVSWNALIAGYANKGTGQEALNCFARIQRDGLSPNEITFLCVLTACSHSGKLDEAQMHYESMYTKYHITPKLEHHTCMVVIFSCVGRFEKAMSVIKTMSSSDHPSVWLALLSACRKWGKVKLGRLAFDQAIHLDNNLAAAYVLMGSIYAAAGMEEDADIIESLRVRNFALKKTIHVDSFSIAHKEGSFSEDMLKNFMLKMLEEEKHCG